MRTILAAAILSSLTAPAFSQRLNLWNDNKPPLTQEEKEKQEALEKAYKSAVDKMPTKKSQASDPWAGVRANTPTTSPKNGR